MYKQEKNGKLIEYSKKISKKTNKSLFSVALDILTCNKKYKVSYEEYYNNEFYLMNIKQKENFISKNYNDNLVLKYNDINYKYIFDNRYEFNKVFKHFIKRDYIILNDKNYNNFVDFLVGKNKIVAKPIKKDSEQKLEVIRINAKTDRKKLFNNLQRKKLFLVEDFIYQIPELNRLCESCVNSVQITTFLNDNNEVIILNRILKMGVNNLLNSLDDGGIYTLLDEKGKVLYPPISQNEKYNIHPKTKIDFNKFVLKETPELEKFVKYIAKELNEVRYVTWDVTLTKNGPLLITADYVPRTFNIKPSLNPSFIGDKTKYNVMEENKYEYNKR